MTRAGTPTLRSFAAVAVAAVWLVLVLGTGGCEALIGDTVPAFRCLNDGPGTCPVNQFCNPDGRCQFKCEVTGCSSGQVCDHTTHVCGSVPVGDSGMLPEVSVADTGPMIEAAPPETGTEASIPDSSMPETAGPCRSAGCPCSGPAGCDSKVCADQLSVGVSLYNAAGMSFDAGAQSFCTKPCCTSADCDAGSVCYAADTGGNYCVLPQWIGRASTDGTGIGGATCATGRDCRSGLCAAGGACADTCCSDQATGECASPSVCTFSKFPGTGIDTNYGANCAASPGTGKDGSSCSGNNRCESQLCLGSGFGGGCAGACRSATDCAAGEACSYAFPSASSDIVAACGQPNGNAPVGSTCSTTTNMCASGLCDTKSLKCTSVCFTNADCTTAGWYCRPELVQVYVQGTSAGSFSVLLCGP